MKNNNIIERVTNTLKSEEDSIRSIKKSLDSIATVIDLINKTDGRIILTGIGKSSFIAMKIAATLTSLGREAFFLSSLDAMHGDIGRVKNGDVFIAISFSGESVELIRLLKYIRKNFEVKIFSITGKVNSSLSKISDNAIIINVKNEGCPMGLAPMASTTASLVVGDLIASGLVDLKKFGKDEFSKFHPGGSLGFSLKKVEEFMATGEKLPIVIDSDSFGDALVEMTKLGLGVVAVVDKKGRLVGVITDGDIRRTLLKHDNPKKLAVKEVMKLEPKTINTTSSLKEALQEMTDNKITNLFVLDSKKKLCGIIHMHSIVADSI